MKTVKLHVTFSDVMFGGRSRKTYLIHEDASGVVDIVEDTRPRCEADRSVPFDDDIVLEVEAA